MNLIMGLFLYIVHVCYIYMYSAMMSTKHSLDALWLLL